MDGQNDPRDFQNNIDCCPWLPVKGQMFFENPEYFECRTQVIHARHNQNYYFQRSNKHSTRIY